MFITYEVVPPRNPSLKGLLKRLDAITPYVSGLNVADTPLGMPRVSSATLSVLLKDRYGIDVIPHLKTINHNEVGLLSLAYGLYAAGIRQFLVIRGDPPRKGTPVNSLSPENAVKLLKGDTYLRDAQVGMGLGWSNRPKYLERKVRARPDFLATQPFPSREDALKFVKVIDDVSSKVGYRPRVVATYVIPSPRNKAVLTALSQASGLNYTSLLSRNLHEIAEDISFLLGTFDGVMLSSPNDAEMVVKVLNLVKEG